MILRNVTVLDAEGPLHRFTGDLRLENGTLLTAEPDLQPEPNEKVVELNGAYVSPGFIDVGVYLGDPGHEEREDRASLIRQAAAGGYVAVAVLPDSDPVRQSVADLNYLTRDNGQAAVDLFSLAALSHDLDGKDLTAMLELRHAGAVGFTDGPDRRVSGSLLKRGLEYARAGDALVVVSPFDPALAPEGQLHEGEVSTRLGLRGIPAMAETIPLKRATELLAYTGGKLLVHLISSAEGVAEVRRAKAAGLDIRCTVGYLNLLLTDERLSGFDPNAKVLPPLRSEADRLALIEGLRDGTIDGIVSNHAARHGEEKDLEFAYAEFGALGLQTAFRGAVSALADQLEIAEIAHKFGNGLRTALDLPPLHLRSVAQNGTGQDLEDEKKTMSTGSRPPAPRGGVSRHTRLNKERQNLQLTVFRTDGKTEFTPEDLLGKTQNSPLLGADLPGKIVGTYANGTYRPAE